MYFSDKASFARTVTGQEPWETLGFQLFIPHYQQLSWSPWQGVGGRRWEPDLLSCFNDHNSSPCQAFEPLNGKQGNCHAQGNRDTQLWALHQPSAGSWDQISMIGTNLYLYKVELGVFGWFSVLFFIWVHLTFHLSSEFPWYVSAHFWDDLYCNVLNY